jgi:glycosyltransferase involved in cell wall biosynthesis
MTISVIVPVYNECDNVGPLCAQLVAVMSEMGRQYEILFVDDGSRDGTSERLACLAAENDRIKVVRFRRNFGQTAALQAGLHFASGETIVTIDGDMQNEPGDIPCLIEKLEEGYDLVHGWRRERHDHWLTRKLPSRIANWLIARVTRFPIHDLGCTLKAMRREIALELELYGEMHRFIPILAHQRGARCAEVVTRHHPRRFGKTKYGLGRTLRVVLDLITVKYMLDYFASPMKLLGKIGLWCALVAMIAGGATVGMKLFGGVDMTGNPLLMLTVLSTMMSGQFIGLGLLAEVNARIYYSSRNTQAYAVAELLNFEATSRQSPSTRSRAA